MDWKRLDSARRSVGPIEVDLIEAYAQNRIRRRDFVKRGAMIGLSVPFMSAIIAACGSDDSGDSADTASAAAVVAVGTDGDPVQGGDLRVGVQAGDANSGLDPVNMLDLGTYSVVSQAFEYLVGFDLTGNIAATGLAESWSPNDDGTAWTFNLREGVMWHDGSPLTAADVAATIDRMVEVGAGLAGVVAEGGAVAQDDATVVVNLENANGNLPVLLSTYNPQSIITPADYTAGTRLDERPAGTGAFIFESHDPGTFTTTFRANPDYWGGAPNLDTVTLIGFEEGGARVAAMQARELNMIQTFGAVDGAGLLADENFDVLSPPSANHRQVWYNTQLPSGGQFTDARVRRALGFCLDRQQIVDVVFRGRGIVANDHPVHPTLPFFDADATPQRPRDIDMARALLAEAGAEDLTATMQVGSIEFSPDMAAIIEQNCAEAGITLQVNVTDNSDFYGEFWCTGAPWGASPETGGPGLPCGASADIGIVDYGHRPVPDIFLTRALQTDGDWNSSNFANSEFDNLVTQYQGAVDVDGQREAIGQIQALLHEEAPALYPAFFDYLSGHDNSVRNVPVTALGHMKFENAWIEA